MTLYVDLIWLLNFLIDYLLIYLTAVVLKRKQAHRRFVIAALFASSIVFFLFSPLRFIFMQPWMKLFYSIVIVIIAFRYRRFTYFLQSLFTFYFVTFMTGGGLIALHYFLQTESSAFQALTDANIGMGTGISWLFVMLGFPLVWWFSKKRMTQVKWEQIRYDELVDVEILLESYTLHVRGFIDSGNQLTDPITKKPVIMIEANELYSHFGKELIDMIATIHETGYVTNDDPLFHRAHIIPYKGIGQTSAFISGIRPDRVTLFYMNKKYESEEVILGLEQKELSPDGQYTCIIHPKVIVDSTTSLLA